jgi:hypothetical protein
MAEQQGGYRRPGNPAPVSGPGALSQRTDGQPAEYMAGGEYGEGQEMMDLQGSAPMSRAPEMRPSRGGGRAAGGGGMVDASSELTSLFAPTQRPDEPLTAGAPFGDGPGPVTQPTYRGNLTATLGKLINYDDTGVLASFYRMAEQRGW